MPKLNIYTQQTIQQHTAATPQTFGAAEGQATANLGSALQDIGFAIKEREDTLDRVRIQNDFDQFAQQSFEALKPEDLANGQTIETYQQGMREKMADLLSQHGGTSTSRNKLQVVLENQIGQYSKGAFSAQVKAQHAIVGSMVERRVNDLAGQAAIAPERLSDIFSEFDASLNELGTAIDPQTLTSYRDAGRGQIATNTISSLLERGNYTAAKTLMSDERVRQYLTPDASRRFGISVAVEEGKAAEAERLASNRVAKYTSMLNRDLTPEEVIRVRNLPDKKSEWTPADEIASLEVVQRAPATQAQIDKIYGTYVDGGANGGMFGNSLKGRALDFVTQNAVAYGMGVMNPDQARQFEAAYTEAYAPDRRQDPITGQWTMYQPSVPAFVQEAMARGGSQYGGVRLATGGAPDGIPAANISVTGDTVSGPPRTAPGQQVNLSVDGQPVGSAVANDRGVWSISGGQESPPNAAPPGAEGSDTVFGLASYLTGPTSSIASAVADAPLGIGEMVSPDPRYTTARSKASFVRDQIANALRPESRIADQYRQELMSLVDIDPKVYGNDRTFRLRVIEIDKQLRSRLKELDKVATGATTASAQDRRDALDLSNAIRAALPTLGVPQNRANTRKEVEALPPGTVFLYGDDPTPHVKK